MRQSLTLVESPAAGATGASADTSREVELILCYTRATLGSDESDSIQELVEGDVDWESLIRRAEALGVLPLLCRSKFPGGAVPAHARIRLETYLQTNARKNLFLTRELLRILQILEENGIPAIPLKGPSLAVLAYGDLGLREFSDLDILLPHGEIRKAADLLASHQYRSRHSFTPGQVEEELRSEHIHHLALIGANTQIVVELHWHLMQERYFFAADLDGMWERRIPQLIFGATLNSLDPEDQLIFLSMHGWKHYWLRLGWIVDLAGVIKNTPSLDWSGVLRRAAKADVKRRVLLGLGLAKHVLRTPLPPLIEREIRSDGALGKLILQAERTLLSQELPFQGRHEEYRHALEISDGVKHRVKILYTFVRKTARLNENDFAWVRLPRPLFFLYYVLHPLRLAAGAIDRVFRSSVND